MKFAIGLIIACAASYCIGKLVGPVGVACCAALFVGACLALDGVRSGKCGRSESK
jgi:hypothetical protein